METMHSTVEWLCRLYFLLLLGTGCCSAKDAQIVQKWAATLGSDLWKLANAVSRPDELLSKYKALNARVEDKSGDELVKIISESVGRMLQTKMDAVSCITAAAEHDAEEWDFDGSTENLTYVSGKYSLRPNESANTEFKSVQENYDNHIYREMQVEPDSHFYNIPVNVTHSSVHIPTNVYDMLNTTINDIKRTESLDRIFVQNYQNDPALSWQYFGSVTGMLRQYPAMQWRTDKSTPDVEGLDTDKNEGSDLYDCRARSWFIEAATCSKDVVILMDTSGSMTGMGKTIAKTTVSAILDTLSNNDFVTLLGYANETEDLVPCFKNMLVQATRENLQAFKDSMENVKTEGVANVTEAFTRAFTILRTYSETRGCDAEMSCNQLIMLVTDGIAHNATEVFKTWNWQKNNTHIPVRVFTYLLGKEVMKVREIQWMACLNRGYYTHIHNQEEVREQVFKYIPVVARPMILQAKHHPIVWTHAYADVSNPALATWLWLVMEHEEQKARLNKYQKGKLLGARINEDAVYIKQRHKDADVRQDPARLNTTNWQEYRLLTSVSSPVFDRKQNRNNETRTAKLLGVAGTDVPIDDIRKLTLPYKLGVNGYAFIVSNNGYVVLHPDLRPVFKGKLKLNYDSVDLTEVEILDDGRGPRELGQEVLKLRQALVDHKHGSLKEIPVKLHYDDNRRVTLEKRDYFFAPLPGTPFALAIALPNYGKRWIKVGNEIRNNLKANRNLSDYFTGDHWRIHPGWVYCRYHYLEGHEFDTAEEELRHFLHKIGQPNWHWSEQYEPSPPSNGTEDGPTCGRRRLKHDDYYCNEELMQLLIFDARATHDSYVGDYVIRDEQVDDLARIYGVYLRFVATQSGLTRWEHVDEHDNLFGIEFGDLYRRAVNEPWYKGAIFQHNQGPESISVTVPWEAGADAIVTVSMGIFPQDAGKEAAAAVVGFQMSMKSFHERFIELTSDHPYLNCRKDGVDCYLIDQNGYVVISEAHNDTGQFLGTQEGAVMASMVGQGLFNAVPIYDYQAWCEDIRIIGGASGLVNPLIYIWDLIFWCLIRLMWITSQFIDLPIAFAKYRAPDPDTPDPPPPPREILFHYPCDQMRTLYIMNYTIAERGITNHSGYCSRPFYAQRVEHTNLLLLVVDTLYPTCYKRLEVTPVVIPPSLYPYGTDGSPCHKIPLSSLPRRRLEKCFTEHPLEHEIHECGCASTLSVSRAFFYVIILTTLYSFILTNVQINVHSDHYFINFDY